MTSGVYQHKLNQGFQPGHADIVTDDGRKNHGLAFKKLYKEHPEKNPWYIDGRSGCLNEYTEDWRDISKIIRHRDEFICQLCGVKRAIGVHHIDYNKRIMIKRI